MSSLQCHPCSKTGEQILSYSRRRNMERKITINFHDIFYDLKKPTNVESTLSLVTAFYGMVTLLYISTLLPAC